ncbi:hypothetical protein F1188_04760 [Roseospira marina]|uniref:Uncharacterized protein n=1 Tax=Roseospira marina TaxID=140057 RepID=A0A5M6IEE4_9PROT|nr:hypothetical protein [Roseospira marina]KAA5606651.1 hypothetical protein F1188_04760 [Roseospira marina]MBB4313943.1 hypothetical protein [Roseospira marina]MBB5087105.1 hypothetical protein [Roseospira marina]
MPIALAFYETPSDSPHDLGRAMDEILAIARAGTAEDRHRILTVALRDMPALEGTTRAELLDHLASCPVWWRIEDDLNIYRTPGAPTLLFAAEEVEGEAEGKDRDPMIWVHVLGATLADPETDKREAWEERILARCVSIGLCDDDGERPS